ncbi:uncharacterized protein LOC124278589 isoform X2 [Haliotis rubra]|uniref:uncharacterized protein LOC124278589 isoform X2 n=1 Tax=Haliotis rubra TaxID=36100 RepID=UPI001EE60391|nr:uncharacterized protein LOC124278589 isoform X2 [Haliotis rubra]
MSGNRCVCSHTRNKPRDKKECNIACVGDKKQNCGGGKAASVFFTGYVKLDKKSLHQLYAATRLAYKRNKSKMTAEMAAYDNLGPCVKISPGKFLSFTTHLMSKELCVVHCFHYKFTYALLSTGEKCTCLPQLPKDAKTYTVLRKDCNMLCPGNMGQRCGGRDGTTYNVWLTGHYNQKDHLSQKDYRPVNALVQGWRSYLRKHPNVADELTRLGVTIPRAPPTVPHSATTTPPQITTLTTGGNDTDVDVEDDVLTDRDSGAASGVLAGAVIAGLVAASAGLGLVLYLRRSKYSNPYGSKKDREEHKLLKKQISEKTPIRSRRTGGFTGDKTDNALAGDGDDEDDFANER